ncbi:L-type lectin-domain containing receptor kinase IV.2-like [Amaranthus tricolor]|uniref:L-type lectin-domain containing receptor kinase IV.2-like n=1 Tax=Amaranthus tricolor TaxID=29722 RepID=UPI0025859C30|nr:L-type lectin-domain containing receptor kinase IV.2-like [Amaranthus tricolor]
MYTYDRKLCSLISFLLLSSVISIAEEHDQFIHHGFTKTKLHLDGLAEIHPNGLLQLTNTTKLQKGHAFYHSLMKLEPNVSFSTSFVFAIYREFDIPHSGHGIAFVMSPSMDFTHTVPAEYLGLFNASNNGSPTNHVFAVELDTVQNAGFDDIDANHVGIDINGLHSVTAATAIYVSENDSENKRLDLTSGKPMHVWIDYDAAKKLVSVRLAPSDEPKPNRSLLSARVDLSKVLTKEVYIGFSSSTGLSTNIHYILGWSWNQSGEAQSLDPSELPLLPPLLYPKKKFSLAIVLPLVVLLVFFISIMLGAYLVVRMKKYEELHEGWESEYSVHRFVYKDLYRATKGFKEAELLGWGGFGKVYRGTLPHTKTQVAVKRISHDSKQGLREFVAEIASMRRLRHRNLVQLLGYCRKKGELLLVYDYMPNGSLDKLLFNDANPSLSWHQRVRIIKGVASALLYLHEEWEQVVVHRDVKASNVLLDGEMNARLGDFGLSRLYDHDIGPHTTRVVGTIGYIAPELTVTGRPTTNTDVFAFGMFMLEVVCGRRPISLQSLEEENLVDWVFQCWENGEILKTIDPRLAGNYDTEEIELILRLGLMCCSDNPHERPSMRQVMQVLDDSNSKYSEKLSICIVSTLYSESVRSASSIDSILQQGR